MIFLPYVLLIEFWVEYFILYNRFCFWKISNIVHVLNILSSWLNCWLLWSYLLTWFFLLFFGLWLKYRFRFVFSFSRIRFPLFRTMIDEWIIIILFFDNRLDRLRLLFLRFFKFLRVIDIYWLSDSLWCIPTSPFPWKSNVCIFRHI